MGREDGQESGEGGGGGGDGGVEIEGLGREEEEIGGGAEAQGAGQRGGEDVEEMGQLLSRKRRRRVFRGRLGRRPGSGRGGAPPATPNHSPILTHQPFRTFGDCDESSRASYKWSTSGSRTKFSNLLFFFYVFIKY